MRHLEAQHSHGESHPSQPSPPEHGASERSQRGLDWFAFFLADVQVGFGPFLSIYLTTAHWTNADIGMVLSAGAILGLLAQVPAGAFIDTFRHYKLVALVATTAIGLSALWIASSPMFLSVLFAKLLHVGGSAVIAPALAAISLGIAGHAMIGERLGRNARFAACGSIGAGALMGFIGHTWSSQVVFYVTALMAIPALVALHYISASEIRVPAVDKKQHASSHDILAALLELARRRPLIILGICVFFFHLANAAMLPLVASTITMRLGDKATLLIALAMIVPQIMVAFASPHIGRFADLHGRRLFLLIGFAVLPVRGVLLASTTDPFVLVTIQILDGISATCLGVLVATSVADIERGSGHFNLALGVIGSAMGLGAAVSTTLAGFLADAYGSGTSLLVLSLMGLAGFLVMAALMPETKHSNDSKA